MNFSSDINEVIRANLNFLVFFLQKDLALTKNTKSTKSTKSTKTQNALKKHMSGKK